MAYFDLYVQTDQLKETVQLARKLGWDGLGLIIPWTSEADLNSFRKSVKSMKPDIVVGVELKVKKASKLRDMARNLRKKVELIFVSGGDPEINRMALSTPEVDVLIHPWGEFQTFIGRLRVNVIFTSNFALKTYFQYNSETKEINCNIRLHLLHGNDNDLFLVYNNVSHAELDRLKGKIHTAALKMNYRIYL